MLAVSATEWLWISALLGLLMGSFLSMLSWRLPRMFLQAQPASKQLKSLTFSRSECPHCHRPLNANQLIPLFSWIISRGKCRHCGTAISIRYPLIELSSSLITLAIAWQFGQSLNTLVFFGFAWLLLAIVIIDIEHQLILDNLSLPLLWLGLLFSLYSEITTPNQAILGAITGYLLLWGLFHTFKFITGKEGMGYGDFKLLAALGAWFGVLAIPQIILIASVSSLIIGGGLSLFKLRNLNDPMPFGPYLGLGGGVTLFFGADIIQRI
ncbi:MAG: prepilin peptidase [Piscirickettsiaceae bacterium CG_4_9_14_3_um_filter_43_564]|nr:prepilin peptidase [Thiomicrospira sp.]OIP94744.1 MAG: prepilin peptidase [Thiomicrospira sp. CG2_30_44_34]PIQ03181.1 MAG: prepilin peptidase [Piscirickettsiaceae bacterium CG18_big_fil_WC_8_21_14_2_50_44_103]PIU39456.1 MAG: prepilin peptidase [Piscirickettsiaceae bacterium CG07_land_8_20_14_0_80_44_28]PIW58543.1 MAG: prepilin peptidase [Piscirickettsiaceae bacterium CG12_big_fil_rev_8_21_14_0_65_44_934]PIW78402.1 MAG: prepilin peptidase [Piscirickettsiaceae bacterium CG_4_8_14_3_um_filter_